jgi:hypothetical protein
MCFERSQGSVVALERTRVHRRRMKIDAKLAGILRPGNGNGPSERPEVTFGGKRDRAEAHRCRRAAVSWRLGREYGCTAHELFEIAASLTMGRAAMRTIVPRLHLGHWSGSIPAESMMTGQPGATMQDKTAGLTRG